MSPIKVIVVGASRHIGKATLSFLVSRHGGKVEIYAIVRNPENFESMDGVKAVKADMDNKEALTETLKEFDHVFLIIPDEENRTELVINGIEAAKEAKVKFLLVLSSVISGTDTLFGKQFSTIETKTKESGLNYTIIRHPLFLDNYYAYIGSIKEESTFYDPRDPTKLHTPVAIADVGKAAADILAAPENHISKTYKLVSPPFSLEDIANAFTKTLGRNIKLTTVPYEASKDFFLRKGLLEWQVEGIMELYKYVDDESALTNEPDTSDIETITGEKPTTIESWVEQNAGAFQ